MKGTYKLDCIILLTAVKLIVDILFAARVEIRQVDILASFKSEVDTCKVIRLPAVVASGKACVLTTAHSVDVFGDTVINPYGCDRRIVETGLSEESLCIK